MNFKRNKDTTPNQKELKNLLNNSDFPQVTSFNSNENTIEESETSSECDFRF